MKKGAFFKNLFAKYYKRMKEREHINIDVQNIYDHFSYGYSEEDDASLLMALQ